jgi:hypothetical protein
MTSELSSVFLYIALFGFSDVFVRLFRITSIPAQVLYYIIVLVCAFLIDDVILGNGNENENENENGRYK